MKLEFTLFCKDTHNNFDNPVPKPRARIVSRGGRTYGYNDKLYKDWQSYIRQKFISVYVVNGIKLKSSMPFSITPYGKIIYDKKQKFKLDIKIYFANNRRGDPEGIFGGIADAIFENDRNLSGSFDFDFDKNNPRVECVLEEVKV